MEMEIEMEMEMEMEKVDIPLFSGGITAFFEEKSTSIPSLFGEVK